MTELKKFSCLNDYLFKSLFRSKEARIVISKFLSELTGIEYETLLNADYQAGEIPKQNENEKGKISDCIVRITDDKKLIVEMNNQSTKYITKKATSYSFGVITESVRSSNRYPEIILINIDNFNIFNTKRYLLTFMLRDEEGHIENELYKSYHIVLENCNKSLYNEVGKFTSFLKMETIKDMRKYFKGDEDYMDAIDKVESFTKDPKFIGYYNEADQIELDKNEAYDAGVAEGIEQEKLKLAKNFKEQGFPIDAISKATGLTTQEIEKL